MIGLVRAATLCATLALGLVTAQAADKAFKRDDLADSAVKLEAQIKSEAGAVAKSNATLKTDADAAFKRSDFRTGLQVLGQIVATSPDDSGNWLRLSRVIFQIWPKNSSEQTFLLERASTAAYIAYQRAGNAGEEADALAVLGRAMSERKLWRPALDAHPQVEDLATHRHATDGIEVGLDELGNLAYQQGEAQDELAHRPPIERRMAAEPAELSRHALRGFDQLFGLHVGGRQQPESGGASEACLTATESNAHHGTQLRIGEGTNE